jgi:hypothetical protein
VTVPLNGGDGWKGGDMADVDGDNLVGECGAEEWHMGKSSSVNNGGGDLYRLSKVSQGWIWTCYGPWCGNS